MITLLVAVVLAFILCGAVSAVTVKTNAKNVKISDVGASNNSQYDPGYGWYEISLIDFEIYFI